jgi:hypothetical protein
LGKVARITTEEQTNSLGLRLFDGSIYERDRSRGGFSQTRFNIYDFKLSLEELVGPVRQRESGPKEMQLLIYSVRSKLNKAAEPTQSPKEWNYISEFPLDLSR